MALRPHMRGRPTWTCYEDGPKPVSVIAQELGLSVRTIDNILYAVKRKLGAHIMNEVLPAILDYKVSSEQRMIAFYERTPSSILPRFDCGNLDSISD